MDNINIKNECCFKYLQDLEPESIDCIITDPPYGVLNHKIETEIDIEKFFISCDRVLKKDSWLVFFGQQPTLSNWILKASKHFEYRQEIIWYKRNSSSPVQKIQRVHENIVIFKKGSPKLYGGYRPYSDVKNSLAEYTNADTLLKQISQLENILKDKRKLKMIFDNDFKFDREKKTNENATIGKQLKDREKWINNYKTAGRGMLPSSLVSFIPENKTTYGKNGRNFKHPTVKPVALIEWLIDLCTQEGDLISDPFLGSGTTAVACLNTKRKFKGCEIIEDYYKMAMERIDAAQNQERLF